MSVTLSRMLSDMNNIRTNPLISLTDIERAALEIFENVGNKDSVLPK